MNQSDIDTYCLLAVDFQNDYCHPDGLMAKEGYDLTWLQDSVKDLEGFLEKVREIDLPTVFVKAVNNGNLSDYELRKQEEKGIVGICEKDSWGSELYLVKPGLHDLVLTKEGYSAFFNTGLEKMLKFRGIFNLLVCGTSTHICVDSTVRDAYQHGFNVYVLEDLVATREEERGDHYHSLDLISRQFGKVIKSSDALEILKK